MLTRLDQLTMAQFVNLMCGDVSVLKSPHEIVKPKKLQETARNLILEFKDIADPAGMRTFLYESEKTAKARLAVSLYTVCKVLADADDFENVRELLDTAGVRIDGMRPDRIKAEISFRLGKARTELKKMEDKTGELGGETDIRRGFDAQTAALMAHFKFQIDMEKIKATVYAHLIARFNAELKAQKAAIENMKKR